MHTSFYYGKQLSCGKQKIREMRVFEPFATNPGERNLSVEFDLPQIALCV
ncbi:MAG: hypothetical protein JWN70_5515 [Planctomycetaceae bacterium]|nr:hypothetical protein [Planctomycetaceae bacterium]